MAVYSEEESNKRNNLWRVIHAAWYMLAFVALGIFIAALPAYTLKIVDALTSNEFDAPPAAVVTITTLNVLASIAAALTSLSLASILFRRKPRDPMALYLSFYLLAYGVITAGPLGMLEGSRRMTESLTIFAEAVLLTTPTIILFSIFPSGHFVPRWTRWVSILSLVWVVAGFELIAHPPGSFDFWSLAGVLVSLLTWCLAAFYGLIYRYRRVSNLVERQQTKWVVFGMAIFFILIAVTLVPYLITQTTPRNVPQPLWALALGPIWWLTLNLLPLSLTIAVMRYRLFDIDIIINRALVYGTLTASTVGLYVVLVGFVASLFHATANPIIAFVATGLVAVIFQPLRERLQRATNHLMYGERDDPYAVLSRLGQRLEATLAPEAVLPTIVETVTQTLKLSCAAIAVKEENGFKIVAVSPAQPSAPPPSIQTPNAAGEILPLTYQGEVVGQFIFSPRDADEPFTAAERRLLEDIAHQAGVAVHAVRLTADLQRSRERIVTAREEERRRLRRDLHDGLGPHLASQSFKLEAARDSIRHNPDKAESLLNDLISKSQNTINDVRRLVYALRPPALDELGLIAAAREHAAQCELNGVRITVAAPDQLPALPAAVEVAAYRIIQEALTNVARHAQAQTCAVSIELKKGALSLQISDDGIGLSRDHHRGVGLNSMRERAEELGGQWVIEPAPNGGTRVKAELPFKL